MEAALSRIKLKSEKGRDKEKEKAEAGSHRAMMGINWLDFHSQRGTSREWRHNQSGPLKRSHQCQDL